MSSLSSSYGATAHPSLALVKYWGKLPGDGGRPEEANLPATTSIAVTLNRLMSRVTVRAAEHDRVTLDGVEAKVERFTPFFDALRARLASSVRFAVESGNNFPTAAGLASSSSGFAALALACSACASPDRTPLPPTVLSELARVGSGSAARAVFGGFTRWSRGAAAAEQLYPAAHWPELRVVVLKISDASKEITSRDAMERTRLTSPYFAQWVEDNAALALEAERALAERDLERLGTVARHSYLRMFATMLGADPPVLYWLPASVAAIKRCERLRAAGIAAFETMDAGPQVKVLTTEHYLESVLAALAEVGEVFTVCSPGPDAALDPPSNLPPAASPTTPLDPPTKSASR